MFHSGSIHAVLGCEESASCFSHKRFAFADLRLNPVKRFGFAGGRVYWLRNTEAG